MKVLITGGSSLLGRYLSLTKPDDTEMAMTWFTNHTGQTYHMDICNKSQVAYVFERTKPNVVIHCAAVGSVDYTERHFTETHMVNVHGTLNVLKATEDTNALFVYISTNAVFDGDNPPYSEESERQPINRYGNIKSEAEDVVKSARYWLIIRPFLLYGIPYPGGRQNWYTTITQNLQAGKVTRLVNDTYWQPTYAEDVAVAIWQLLDKPGKVYHVAANDKMTLYDFGLKIAKHHKKSGDFIQPIASSELKDIAPRPVDTTFNLDRIHELGISCREIKEGLKAIK